MYVYLFLLWEAVLKKENKGNKAFSRIISGREKQWYSDVHRQRLMRICPHSSFQSVERTLAASPLLGMVNAALNSSADDLTLQDVLLLQQPCAQASLFTQAKGYIWAPSCFHLCCISLLSYVQCSRNHSHCTWRQRCIPHFTCFFMVLFLNGRVKA